MTQHPFLILCVDDERTVLDSVVQELEIFEEHFIVEAAESVDEAREVIAQYAKKNITLALILCDHIMPVQTGIHFLIELNNQEDTVHTRKLLLTGQAGLDDTVEAINHACLDFYLSKPWNRRELQAIVRHQLTLFIINHESNLMPWLNILETDKLLNAMEKKRNQFGE